MRRLLAQFSQFGLVGLVGFALDLVIFNVLRATILNPDVVVHGAAYATVISTVVAIAFNWLGNRFWTFRHQRHHHWVREGIEFAIVSLVGLAITLGCLYVSSNVLGFHGVVADNIAKNVVGLGLGTIFRFALYRLWVFKGHEPEPLTGSVPVILSDDEDATARPAAHTDRDVHADRDAVTSTTPRTPIVPPAPRGATAHRG